MLRHSTFFFLHLIDLSQQRVGFPLLLFSLNNSKINPWRNSLACQCYLIMHKNNHSESCSIAIAKNKTEGSFIASPKITDNCMKSTNFLVQWHPPSLHDCDCDITTATVHRLTWCLSHALTVLLHQTLRHEDFMYVNLVWNEPGRWPLTPAE